MARKSKGVISFLIDLFLVEVDASPMAPLELSNQEKNSIDDPMEEALALCSGSFPTDR